MGSDTPGDRDEASSSNGGLTRRRMMQLGAGGFVGAALPAAVRTVEATPSNLPGSTTINPGDQGLDPGEDIGPYFDEHADHTVTATSDHLGNGYADSRYFTGDLVDYSYPATSPSTCNSTASPPPSRNS